jgi:hypothetical protein
MRTVYQAVEKWFLWEGRDAAGLIISGDRSILRRPREEMPPVAAEQLRKVFKGNILVPGGFDAYSAEAIVEKGIADLVAFGRCFIANPDLPKRIKQGLPPNAYDRAPSITTMRGDIPIISSTTMNRMLLTQKTLTEISAKKVCGNPDKTIPYRFKPGQFGVISTAIREKLKEVCRPGDKTVAEELVEAAIKKARKGDMRALQILIEHAEGN